MAKDLLRHTTGHAGWNVMLAVVAYSGRDGNEDNGEGGCKVLTEMKVSDVSIAAVAYARAWANLAQSQNGLIENIRAQFGDQEAHKFAATLEMELRETSPEGLSMWTSLSKEDKHT
jgi:hypothetical protein